MSLINPHDPMFPQVTSEYAVYTRQYYQVVKSPGMTIRTHLVGIAMLGLLSNSDDWGKQEAHLKWIVECSVKYADALIEELNKSNK